MPHQLTENELELGFQAIAHHGHGSFFPPPPEWQLVVAHWERLKPRLANIDLHTYQSKQPLQVFVPKSRLAVRLATLLHPLDLVLLTSLVLKIRDQIGRARISINSSRVFSYRTEGIQAHELYRNDYGYRQYKDRIRTKLRSDRITHVGLTDIADFFPRIYQHRLTNSLHAATGNAQLHRDDVRCLEKLLNSVSGGASYGVPVGPCVSRLLGEATLIDIDTLLQANRIDFVRYMDDYVFFGQEPGEVERAIYTLATNLYNQHGLNLQSSKTRLVSKAAYLAELNTQLEDHNETLTILQLLMDENSSDFRGLDDLDDDELQKLEALNLKERLENALQSGEPVNYRETSFILSRLSGLHDPDLVPVVLDNINRLYPVAHAVARFFREFTEFAPADRRRTGDRLLRPLLRDKRPPAYYSMWILDLFRRCPEWNHADMLLQAWEAAPTSEVSTRRYAALALSACGSRAHARQLAPALTTAPPLVSTAVALSSTTWGEDERRFARRKLNQQSDPLIRLGLGGQI